MWFLPLPHPSSEFTTHSGWATIISPPEIGNGVGGGDTCGFLLTDGLVVGVKEDSDDVAHGPLFAVGFPKSPKDLFLAAIRNCDIHTIFVKCQSQPGSIIGPGGVVPTEGDIGAGIRQSPADGTGTRGQDLHLVVPGIEEG